MGKCNGDFRELPTWQLAFGSLAIGGHFLAVLAMILAAPSGPWPSADGGNHSTPPQFAYSLNNLFPASYLQSLGMADDYHFIGNNPAQVGVSIELRLEDADGRPLTTLTLPDAEGNWWVRHRQSVLARGLADDIPVSPPEGEMVPAPNQTLPGMPIWELAQGGGLELHNVPEHLIPRERPVFRPSEKSLLLARAYARYACRTHGAVHVEIVRRTQEPIPPAVMFLEGPPPSEAAGELISSFGEFTE